MNNQTTDRAVDQRLAVYNPDNQLNAYLNAVSELTTVSFATITGTLEDKHELSLKKINQWRSTFDLKRADAEIYVETEKLKVGIENSSAAANIENIKRAMTEDLSTLQERNKILRERNDRLRAMNSHIDIVNEKIEDMQKGKSKLSASQEEWEKHLGSKAVAQMLRAKIFRRQMTKVREEDADVEYEELSVQANFSTSAKDLERTNDSMKQSIRRLHEELREYQDKWSHNAQLFDKIADVLKEELVSRKVVKSVESKEDDSEEVQNEDDDEDEGEDRVFEEAEIHREDDEDENDEDREDEDEDEDEDDNLDHDGSEEDHDDQDMHT
ncbi:LAME_0E08746g1_1 [Lachancea meyersii CBS 8951]|uniref:LAME_0E08746g1_1 n=1 Tax=Lachancea meyersii CBS 8951 TaxID=1266667 RepID=A0A1G4JJ90_9SACH|nr:LAME_0E08746g1_1 [Lachancea meyersii CBS 8951]